MEEMGIEPIVSCTPNQHSPTFSAASGRVGQTSVCPSSIQAADRLKSVPLYRSRYWREFKELSKGRQESLRRFELTTGCSPNSIRPRFVSIKERHITPARRQMFGVHQHAMPAAEDDRLVIRMPDAPAHVYLGVSPHLTPVPLSGLRVVTQKFLVRAHRHTRRVVAADHHYLACRAIGVLAHMSLAAASATE